MITINGDQLIIFNPETGLDEKEYCIGDTVTIRRIEQSQKDTEPEDYYYIKGFENRTGTIREIMNNSSGTSSYRVEFSEASFGYFYAKDFE